MQLLDYGPGQFYGRHHDQGQAEAHDPAYSPGPRVLTFFLYLSDVEEGGETEFTDIGLKVKPKKGSAILWPSVRNHNLTTVDRRTHHAALPVLKGRKYAANTWIHLYDYRTPEIWGCTGGDI
jgi:prolyl 4-hydroxylase